MPKTLVRIHHLQMTDPAQLRPATRIHPDAEIKRAEIPSPELNRYFYTAVGGDWYWRELLNWTYDQWRDLVDRPEFETWIATVRGTPAGYYELDHQADNTVEIVHFGLLPAFIGQGLGGQLLTHALHRAWERGPERVWLHTCTLDHPLALSNYQARGLQLYRQDEKWVDLPDAPVGPWPGAQRPIAKPTPQTQE
jgi:GNAT superfamily N-acetyltransferase